MTARTGLALGLAVLAIAAALLFAAGVNRDLAALHRRLDQHEKFIGVLATLMPVVRPIPSEERPPAP